MNYHHLEYVIQVAQLGSIRKASEQLFIAQPNLSNIIKNMETTLGFPIFKRTNQGVVPTKEGYVFLDYAKDAVAQMEKLRLMYFDEEKTPISIRVASVRSSYMSHLIADTINELKDESHYRIDFEETSHYDVINRVIDGDANIGLILYTSDDKDFFINMLEDRQLNYTILQTLQTYILTSKHSKLAKKSEISMDDLYNCTEIIHADFEQFDLQNKSRINIPNKVVYVYDRGTLMDVLHSCPDSFLITPSTHSNLIDRFSLVAIPFNEVGTTTHVLLTRKAAVLSNEEQKLIEKIKHTNFQKEIYND